MKPENLTLKVEGNQTELRVVYVEGKELPLHEPTEVVIVGNSGTVLEFITKRISVIDPIKSIVIVDKNNFSINFLDDQKNFYGSDITSKLSLSLEFLAFGINSDKQWDCFKLGDFIKMNRSFVESKEVAGNLVALLKNFKAKVDKEREKMSDNRGSYDDITRQIVTSNLPENFRLNIPIFKGCESRLIEIEIYIDPHSLTCQLVSPEANDFIHEQSNQIIDDELTKIAELAPGIAIIYK